MRSSALLGVVALSFAACDGDDPIDPVPLKGAGGSGGSSGSAGAGAGGSSGAGSGGAGSAGASGTGGSGAVDVQLLAFNDFHGNLEALKSLTVVTEAKTDTTPEKSVEAGGGAFFAAHVAALRSTNPNTLLVSAGDAVGGSPLASSIFHDEPTIELMNAMGLNVNGVGNHEFDEGSAELLRMAGGSCHPQDGCQFQLPGTPAPAYGGADYPILGANVIVEATGQTLLPPTHLLEVGGVKIGFIGLTLEKTPTVVTASGVAGLRFEDEVETVNKLVPGLQQQGAKAIVVLVHEGGVQTGLYDECVNLTGDIVPIVAALDPAVDVVVSGHTHRAYNCTLSGKLVTSALSAGRILTKIDLRIDPTAGVVSKTAKNILVSRDVAPDPVAQGIIDATLATADPLARRVVGHITTDLPNDEPEDRVNKTGETILGDVIADAQRAATDGPAEGEAVIAFMNYGGVRAPILYSPGNGVADGDVTYGALFTTQPFGNYLVTMTLTGKQIETLLEQQVFPLAELRPRVLQVSSGFTYTWDATKAIDASIGKIDIDPATIKLNGVVIDPLASYRVTVNNFLSTGGDNFTVLKDGTNRLDGVDDLQALEDYFTAQQGPLVTPGGDRITRLN